VTQAKKPSKRVQQFEETAIRLATRSNAGFSGGCQCALNQNYQITGWGRGYVNLTYELPMKSVEPKRRRRCVHRHITRALIQAYRAGRSL
jgi:hypothetical protein